MSNELKVGDNELKVGDRVAIRITYRGTLESISDYREPNRKYAIAVDGYPENHIFVGDKEIQKIL